PTRDRYARLGCARSAKAHSISRVELERVGGADSRLAGSSAGADISSEPAGARVAPARGAAVAGLSGSRGSGAKEFMSEARATDNLTMQYAAVRDGGVGLIDLSSRGRISVSGSEAVMFLNGLITNDMKTLGENRWMP